jgi:hypothetical protein
MRVIFLTIIIASRVCLTPSHAQEITVQQAADVLRNTKPMIAPFMEMGLVDPEKRRAARQLYEEQIKAIQVIGGARVPDTARLLIPYLDYPTKNAIPGTVLFIKPEPENVNYTLSKWPALSALLNIPDSEKILADYALDTGHKVRFRFAALHALRYYPDKSQFRSVSAKFDKEFASADSHITAYLKAIENGKRAFSGAYPIEGKY